MGYAELAADVKREVTDTERVSPELLRRIDAELHRNPLAELWVLRGDAIQISDGSYSIAEAEDSYHRAIELDANCSDAYESLGYFLFAVKDKAAESIYYFREAIGLGAGASASDGLRQAQAEIAQTDHR